MAHSVHYYLVSITATQKALTDLTNTLQELSSQWNHDNTISIKIQFVTVARQRNFKAATDISISKEKPKSVGACESQLRIKLHVSTHLSKLYVHEPKFDQ